MGRAAAAAAWVAAELGAASLELTPKQVCKHASELRRWAAQSPRRRTVGVTHLPGHDFHHSLRAVRLLRQIVQVDVVPTVAARNFRTLSEVRDGLSEMEELLHGQRDKRVLLVGGDRQQPAGAIQFSSDILESGVVAQSGFARIGLPIFPEGTTERKAGHLLRNINLAVESGLDTFLVSQFMLRSDSTIVWLESMDDRLAQQELWFGVLGPSDPRDHHLFAKRCGVQTERTDTEMASDDVPRMATFAGQVDLVNQMASNRMAPTSIHVYPMGQMQATLDWTQH